MIYIREKIDFQHTDFSINLFAIIYHFLISKVKIIEIVFAL